MDQGNIDDVYGHCESDFGQVDLPWFIRDPQSEFSSGWDMAQVGFLLYVSWTVPLRACFEIQSSVLFTISWFVDTVSKSDGFCIPNEESCIKHDGFCIKNEELCIKSDEFCIKNDEFCIKKR